MSSSLVRRVKYHKSPPQPYDRHLAEINQSDGSVYINAGIDSTCCKKRGRTLHKLTKGIMVSSSFQPEPTAKRTLKSINEDFISELTNDNSNDDQSDTMNIPTCSHCGK